MELNKAYIVYYFKINFEGEDMYGAQEAIINVGEINDSGVNLRKLLEELRVIVSKHVEMPLENVIAVSREEYEQNKEEIVY